MAKAKVEKEPEAELPAPPPVAETEGPLTLDQLFKFIEARGAKRVQLIRATGSGRLDATINPVDTGNILIVVEVNPNKGIVL